MLFIWLQAATMIQMLSGIITNKGNSRVFQLVRRWRHDSLMNCCHTRKSCHFRCRRPGRSCLPSAPHAAPLSHPLRVACNTQSVWSEWRSEWV